MKISKNGLNLIKQFEGFSSTPYLCPAKIPTIGFGSTYYPDGKKVTLQDKEITEEKAFEILEYIANKDFGSNINKVVKVPLNQNQLDALVSFAYNVGNGNFNSSTLLRWLNQGNYKEASMQLLRWNKSKGIVLNGLTKRRKSEKALFDKVSN
ncbi:MAG: lysozyme [Paraclostridium sp.]